MVEVHYDRFVRFTAALFLLEAAVENIQIGGAPNTESLSARLLAVVGYVPEIEWHAGFGARSLEDALASEREGRNVIDSTMPHMGKNGSTDLSKVKVADC